MKQKKLCAVLALIVCTVCAVCLAGCKGNSDNKSSVAKTENIETGTFTEKLTAKVWKRDDNGSVLKLNPDGTAKLTMKAENKDVTIDGSWSVDYDALKITLKQNVVNGKLVNKSNTDVFTAFYTELSDSKIKDKDIAVSYRKWYVSDNYLVLGAIIWAAQ